MSIQHLKAIDRELKEKYKENVILSITELLKLFFSL